MLVTSHNTQTACFVHRWACESEATEVISMDLPAEDPVGQVGRALSCTDSVT